MNHQEQVSELHSAVKSASWVNRNTAKLLISCLTVFACTTTLGLAFALYSTQGQIGRLRDERECFQTASNDFNEAVANGIEVLLDLNDANIDLNSASIDLNAALIDALISLGRKDDAELQAALDRASGVVVAVDPSLERARKLGEKADKVVDQLHAALAKRVAQLQTC